MEKDTQEMESDELQKTGRKKRRKKKILIIVIVIAAVLLALLGIAYAVIHHYYAKSNYVQDGDVAVVTESELPQDVQEENSVDSMWEEAQREAEEKALAALGYRDFRVRLFHGLARVQVPAGQMALALEQREEILAVLGEFDGAVLDLQSR